MATRVSDSGAIDSLSWAHPVVRDWFFERFGSATEPQELAWPHIVQDRSVLISAPTGSGKTFAAFLACIDALFRKAVGGELSDQTEVVYISPLKALSNDVQKNLAVPLAEICWKAQQEGWHISETAIRVAVRTGDTLQSERREFLKRPPHILVTTPESLYILLTAEKSRQILKNVRTVIVDEIHAVADDKRGAHLALSLERLEALAGRELTRIGLSATQKPIELVAQFLTGKRKKCTIIDVGHKRQLDLAVEVPEVALGAVASGDTWERIHERLVKLIGQHSSTLIFVNTRKVAERLTMNLTNRLGANLVAAHHGSLSRHLRLDAENRLKSGQLKALVATASLELGIDVGAIDLVCQISSPRSIAVALQRVGRAGHWRGAIPKGRFFPTTRDDLIECAALVKAIQQNDLDSLVIPDAPIDVLCQQIVASCSAEEWLEKDLFDMVRTAYPYHHLSRESFDELLEMLSEGIAGERGRYSAYLFRDRVSKLVKARRSGRLVSITSGGAIPDSALFNVVAEPEGVQVGTLDEDFAVESHKGDIILLGNTSWRIRRIESKAGRIVVEDAHGAPPTVPFWMGEAPSRTPELSSNVSEIRQTVQRLEESGAAIDWLKASGGVDERGARQITEYIREGVQILTAVPSEQHVVFERFFDESGGMQIVVHAPFGSKVTKAWGLALTHRLKEVFGLDLQSAATDNGITIALPDQISFPLFDLIGYLDCDNVEPMVIQAALQAPVFTTRFRWSATLALALLRFSHGKKVPPPIQRMKAEDLLLAIFPGAHANPVDLESELTSRSFQHPLIKEVLNDVLHEAMDIDKLKEILSAIATGAIQCTCIDTPLPSVFSHEILNANPYAFLDDAPLAERRARAVSMRRILPAEMVQELGLLDQSAITQVREESWPDVRDLDELHDVLYTLMVLPADVHNLSLEGVKSSWAAELQSLKEQKRACLFEVSGREFWTCPERAPSIESLYPGLAWLTTVVKLAGVRLIEKPCQFLIGSWMSHIGPTSASRLASLLALPAEQVNTTLFELERQGSLIRGNFSADAGNQGELQWCDRRLLSRIHRLTVSTRRAQVEPVSAATYLQWLTYWQHVAGGSQLTGERGTLEIIKQLQGFEAAAVSWEREILQRRIYNYDCDWLDNLCLNGSVGWGRFSPHPALTQVEASPAQKRRIVPSSVAPVTFFVREESAWMGLKEPVTGGSEALSYAARTTYQFLSQRGASFFADISRAGPLLKSEVESALWELVSAGLVTADGFDNLRALVNPRRRAGKGSSRGSRPRNSAGRWSLMHTEDIEHAAAIESLCHVLLNRYGVVFREILTNETIVSSWRDLLLSLRRMEDKGEVVGGRFLDGFSGEQFALSSVVESIRGFKRQPKLEYRLVLSAVDPLNLSGVVGTAERIPAKPGKAIILHDGIFEPG